MAAWDIYINIALLTDLDFRESAFSKSLVSVGLDSIKVVDKANHLEFLQSHLQSPTVNELAFLEFKALCV